MKNRFPYSKKFIAAALAIAVAVPGTSALASVDDATDGLGNIQLTVLDDDKTTAVSGATYTITDSTGAATTGSTNVSGSFTTAALTPGVYTVQIVIDGVTQITKVTVKAGTTPTKVNFMHVTSDSVDAAKTGLISDVVFKADGTTALTTGTKVRATNGTTTWETTTDANGKFAFYLTPGKYNLSVEGKDVADDPATAAVGDTVDYKNEYYPNLVVAAGQKSAPFETINAEQLWGLADEEKLGFELDTANTTIANDTKEIKGKANPDTTVSVYDGATLIASTVAKKAGTGGAFSIKVPTALGGKTITIKVKDQVGNEYVGYTGLLLTNLPALTIKADEKDNTADKAIELTYTDEKGLFAQSITAVKVDAVTLTKDKYKVSNGKITFNVGTLTAASNSITVEAAGYVNAAAVTQAVNAASLNATAAKGATKGVKFSYVPAPGTKLVYVVKPLITDIATPGVGALATTIPTGSVDYVAGTDIAGVDATTNKFVGVYEVKGPAITKFKLFTLTPAQIKIPKVAAKATDNTVQMAADGLAIGANNKFVLNLGTSATVKAGVTAADLTITGLPAGLTATPVKVGNTIEITVAGTATTAVTALKSARVIVKGSAVEEVGALDSAAVNVVVKPN